MTFNLIYASEALWSFKMLGVEDKDAVKFICAIDTSISKVLKGHSGSV